MGKLVNPIGAKFLMPCNVCEDSDLEAVMEKAAAEFGKIDFLLHSIAFAPPADLTGPTWASSREGFRLAMEISAYSLLAVCNAAKHMFSENSSVAAMTYFGGEKCVPGYNVMGICKAALDACVRYLAYDLGPQGTRVNALSAGPIRTLAGKAAGVDDMQKLYQEMSPLQRNVGHEEVAKTGATSIESRAIL